MNCKICEKETDMLWFTTYYFCNECCTSFDICSGDILDDDE